MIRNTIISGIISMVALALSFSAKSAVTADFYADSSVLKSGKWVKVGVEETGVYEISYATLRQMGFSNPSQVSVYGRGGRVLPEAFVSNSGQLQLSDDLSPVRVIHEDDMLYFYGLGPEEIAFETSSSYALGGYFSRKSNNVYSKRGYYFLTDSKQVSKVNERDFYNSTHPVVDRGVSYVYHELDSVQNNTLSGQLFWGESLNLPNATRRYWSVDMPDAIAGNGVANGVMECVIYGAENNGGIGNNATIHYGFDGFLGYSGKYPFVASASNYTPKKPTVYDIEIPGNKGRVSVGVDDAADMADFLNLDFWVVSYGRTIPTMNGTNGEKVAQQIFALPDVPKNTYAQIQLANTASLIVLDVTNAAEPQRMKIVQQGPKGMVGVRNSGKAPVLVVFDKEQHQKQISGYETEYIEVENQDLHSLKEEGAELVIITTPRFLPYAEEIADLHRKYDDIKVAVVTSEQCYNEFSGGTPDPMAYRSFAKMLYFSDCKPRNMLLFGPLVSDFRGVQVEHSPNENLIAYQSPQVSITRGAHNINDFYGIMGDKFNTDYYERNQIDLGIGILPVRFETSAEILVKKIKDYLERKDHAYFLNRYTGIGGVGDEHTHDIQIREIDNHIRGLNFDGFIFTPLAIDTYGYAESRQKLFNQLNDGCSMFSYFGHGAEQFLGGNRLFFTAGDVFRLRNKVLPLALFGGCEITNTDRGFRGLGETIVTDTPYGTIGSIVSARETWSGQNLEFFKQFFICLHKEGSSASSVHRKNPVTIGEVYSKVKSYSSYSNELAYQLICDPALVIPTINRRMVVSGNGQDGEELMIVPGNKITVTGYVADADGNIDTDFNGDVVVRLNEPEKIVPASMIESKEDPKSLAYSYRDQQVSMSAGEVKAGNFEIEIHVPSSLATFTGQNANFYLCAYDPSTKIGGASSKSALVSSTPNVTDEAGDHIPPMIEKFEFVGEDCSIDLAVSDNVGLNLSNNPLKKGLFLYIDGKELTEAHFVEPLLIGDKAYSKYINIESLAAGEHTARLKVKDVSGNVSESEIFFTYNPSAAKYAIVRSEASSMLSTVISIDGVAPAKASLVVLSPEGTEVWKGEFKGNDIEWNHEYAGGGKVPAGHYKAYLIETGAGMKKGHSASIDIPVI